MGLSGIESPLQVANDHRDVYCQVLFRRFADYRDIASGAGQNVAGSFYRNKEDRFRGVDHRIVYTTAGFADRSRSQHLGTGYTGDNYGFRLGDDIKERHLSRFSCESRSVDSRRPGLAQKVRIGRRSGDSSQHSFDMAFVLSGCMKQARV